MSWKCINCDTYNQDDEDTCFVCGHIKGEDDIEAGPMPDKSDSKEDSSSTDESSSKDSKKTAVLSPKDSSGKRSETGSESGHKSNTWKTIIIIALAACLLVAFLTTFSDNSEYSSWVDDNSWEYSYTDSQEMEYGDVIMNIPADWEWYTFEDEYEGAQAGLMKDEDVAVWSQIGSFGEYDSMDEFCDDLHSYNIPTSGYEISIDNCQAAIACDEYESSYGYTIIAYLVLVNNHGYWVGVASLPDYYDSYNMHAILDDCTFG